MKYIAIVGRPNVGKSTLFNKILGQRSAIVDDTPGVTRDRNVAVADWDGKTFTIIDTGGFEPESKDELLRQMREQAQVAIEESDFIFFIVDGRTGLTQADREISNNLRKSGRDIYLVVNKIDRPDDHNASEFMNLGFSKVYPISAEHSLGIGDLLEDALMTIAPVDEDEGAAESKVTKIAVAGKPNVGKSSLVNRLTGADRMMVSDIAGTTRDAIDTEIKVDGERYLLIDTAGIRRKAKVTAKLEKFSVIMAMKAIEKADVVVMLIDAIDGVSTQEAKIGGMIEEAGKGCVILVNKWDLMEKTEKTSLEMEFKIRDQMKFLAYAPIMFISATSGQRVSKIWNVINAVKEQMGHRIPSSKLNVLMDQIKRKKKLPYHKSKQVKIYYMTQAGVNPPTFVFMTNYPEAVHFSYRRYISNQIRERCGLDQTPMKLIFRRPPGRRRTKGKY